MTRKKRLNKKQLALIDDLFVGELDEQAVLDKHGIGKDVYNRWLADELFSAEFARRIAGAHLQSQALIARYSLVAATKLVELTESESQETARKACLDIISLPKLACKRDERPVNVQDDNSEDIRGANQLSAETAGRLLAVLAEDREDDK